MKKIIKLLSVMVLLATSFISKPKADTIQDYMLRKYDIVEGVYVTKLGQEVNTYDYMYIIARKSDGKFVYCIQPGVSIDEDKVYQGYTSDLVVMSQLTPEQWDRIQTIAYYGYGYVEDGIDHSDKKWYAVTQFMIWQTAPNGNEIFFVDKLQGNKIDLFAEEMAEMERLLEEHMKRPRFEIYETEMVIGETQRISDKNNILNKFEVSSSNNNVSVSKNGNDLYITANSNGSSKITLSRKSLKYETPPIIYRADDSQTVMSVGHIDPVELDININIVGGSIKIQKVDSETNGKAQGSATLSGAKYDILDSNKVRVATLTTDANGIAQSKNILTPNQTYYLKEVSASKGYLIDTKEYPFSVSKDNLNISMTVKEEVIKNYISILKQYEYVDENTTFLNAEQGIIFEIFDSNNNKYAEIKTDKNGYASINLPYGVYRLSQKNTTEGYEKIYDFYVTVDENSEKEQYYNILNNKLSAYLRLKKVDSETGKTIALPNTKFKILNTDTNQYVSQYVSGKVHDSFYTDESGNMTTYLKLEAGNYRIVEIEAPKGYLLSNEGVNFTIGSNTKYHYTSYGAFVLVEFKNKPIKGQVEIFKSGDDFIIEDGKFKYVDIKLDGVVYEIYASEDIVSSDGQTLYYKQGDLVDILTTDKNGYAISKKLPLGKYHAIERETKDDYVLDIREHHFELTEKDNRTAIVSEKLEVYNYLKKGKLEFTKTDLVDGTPIPNVEISVYTEDDKLIFNGLTDENGMIIIENLKVGKYYILEKNPVTGYLLNEEKVIFEILEDGDIIKAKMTNEKITGDLEFTKTDLITGEAIPNTLIEVRNSETNELVFSGKTDENGKISIKGLKYGKYFITEKEPATGYVLSDERVDFEILEDGSIIKAEMTNRKIYGTLEFSKIDISTSEPLPNTIIEIYKLIGNEKYEKVFEGMTDGNGMITIDNLEYGSYYILEKNPPENYQLNEEKMYFEIKEDGEIIKATMVNEKIVIETPITGMNDNYMIEVIISLLLISGVGVIIYVKKNKRK